MSFSKLLLGLALCRMSIAGYVLEDDYTPSKFFSMFNFFTSADPTHGFVKYVNQDAAHKSQLISTTANSVYIGVDHTNVQPGGRPSVRLTSRKSYNQGLIILDLDHMPSSTCGTWPAFWMVGPNWPYGGEIDIIEGVNEQATNAMTLHTGPGCAISNSGLFSGSLSTKNCYVKAPGQWDNAGCSIGSASTKTYGNGFNNQGGGVYATLWNKDAISVYHFSRGSIPSDITSGSPNPANWGLPQAHFSGACDIPANFKDLQIVFDTTFCGDWAGGVWGSGSCGKKAPTCESFVAKNPSAFKDSYWGINSLKVYQYSGKAPDPVTPKPAPSPTKIIPILPSLLTKPADNPVPSIPVPLLPTTTSSDIPTTTATALQFSLDLSTSTDTPSSTLVTAPYPAGNSTSSPFPSGTIGSRPYPFRNGSHPIVHTVYASGFVTVTVTKTLTVYPTPAGTGVRVPVIAAEVTNAPELPEIPSFSRHSHGRKPHHKIHHIGHRRGHRGFWQT